jgi:copper resistance protein B
MRRVALVALLTVPGAVAAQDHSMHMPGMQMPGMTMPPAKPKPAPKKTVPAKKAVIAPAKPRAKAKSLAVKKTAPAAMDHSQMDHSQMDHGQMDHGQMDHGQMDHDAMDHGAMAQDAAPMAGMEMGEGHAMAMPPADPAPAVPAGTALPAGNAAPPPVPMDHYADRFFDPQAMTAAREEMMREQGGQRFTQVMLNLAEAQIRNGRDGYRWEGQLWFGGDVDRFVVKSEGAGDVGGGVDEAEVQGLYSRAVGPFFNLQAGVRHDFAPSPTRTYATIGVEGLAPYMFDVGAAAFVSDKGDVLGRLEGYYDQRLTQRWVLQPRVELNLAAQDVPENGYGAGLVNAELGLRLRYEISRQLAPYIGVSHEARVGRSARFARAAGQDVARTSLVAGVRFWF